MKKLNLNRLARKSLDKVMNESFTARTSSTNQSDLKNRADKMVGKKYSVNLYWEAFITDVVFADSEEEAIEIALERNKNRIKSASQFVELYDSTKGGVCPNHVAFEDE